MRFFARGRWQLAAAAVCVAGCVAVLASSFGLDAVRRLREPRQHHTFDPRTNATVTENPSVPFTPFVIDHALAGVTIAKGLADLDGDGRLDAIIGMERPGGSGVVWYEFPHSGRPQDHWIRHTITPTGNAYEDLTSVDLDGDGRLDVIASINNDIVWFRNPGPTTRPWLRHRVGTGHGENTMALADLDGDGRVDVVTNRYVFFQDSRTRWSRKEIGSAFRGTAMLDIGSGRGAINLVTNAHPARDAVWYENPREHGGNARTDDWISHTIGPVSDCQALRTCKPGAIPFYGDDAAAFATADLNGDGRTDVVMSDAEADPRAPAGGLVWWEAPIDRSARWTAHVIDSSWQSSHNVLTRDVNGDHVMDVVAAEEEQSANKRVGVFLNDGHAAFTLEVLSTVSGHNPAAADVDGDGHLDILNSPHGFTGAPRTLVLYLNGSEEGS